MSPKERRERQKLATREGILGAALQIARSDGWAAVTVRRVAEIIEYTPPIIYEYFASKDALLEELQRQGFVQLADAMRQATVRGADARERLLQMCDAYVRFAYDQPELYQIMHGWNSAAVALDTTLIEATRVAEIAQACLDAWATEQKVVFSDPDDSLDIAWALLHGLVSIEMMGRLRGGRDRVAHLARQAVDDLLSAWSAH